MCFKAITKEAQTPHIAETDIKVYKLCKLIRGIIYSLIFMRVYEPLVKQPEVSIELKQHDDYYIIKEGYHSLKNATFSIKNKHLIYIQDDIFELSITDIVIGEFIIPKGSIYYENSLHEIVSSNIIFTGIYTKSYINNNGKILIGKHNINEKDRKLFNKISG